MSAPHDETHEMHNEVATVARAMLSAGLAVADGRRHRQLRAARDAERALPQAPRTEPKADRTSGPAPERATDQAGAERPTQQPGYGGALPDPGGFSRRDIQQRADTMAATPGSAEHDARLRDVVSAAVPATAEAVLADPAWPALRAGLRHIENNGGDPRAELAAAAGSRPLRGADSAARVLRWRLATRSAEQDRANGTSAAPADTRDRDAGTVLRALAEDPVGTAAAYADAEAHRDTHPAAAQAWDEALRAENIDPQRVRDDAAAHRDTTSTDHPGTDRTSTPSTTPQGTASRRTTCPPWFGSASTPTPPGPSSARATPPRSAPRRSNHLLRRAPCSPTVPRRPAWRACRIRAASPNNSRPAHPGGRKHRPLADAKTTRSGTATAHGNPVRGC